MFPIEKLIAIPIGPSLKDKITPVNKDKVIMIKYELI
jgi:hypothetical protein